MRNRTKVGLRTEVLAARPIRIARALGRLLMLFALPAPAYADLLDAAIEVRLETSTGGTGFSFADNTVVQLERWTLLRTQDVRSVRARPTRNPNNAGRFEVVLAPTKAASLALEERGNRDRTRRYCFIVSGTVEHCSGFPPEGQAIFSESFRLMDRAPRDAKKLEEQLTAAIATCRAVRESAEKASLTSPRALLDLLYRRALKDETPQWFEREGRETFLSRSFIAAWKKADAAEEAGNEDLIVSADPIAATNGLTLKSDKIAIERESAATATASVTLGYEESEETAMARYELVRKDGAWRLGDIWSPSSLREALAAFAAAPPEARGP